MLDTLLNGGTLIVADAQGTNIALYNVNHFSNAELRLLEYVFARIDGRIAAAAEGAKLPPVHGTYNVTLDDGSLV